MTYEINHSSFLIYHQINKVFIFNFFLNERIRYANRLIYCVFLSQIDKIIGSHTSL